MDRVGPYRVLFRIARGGMAEVFAACRRSHGGFVRTVAIKRLLPHLAEDQRFVDMILDESRLAASISSANVAQVVDQGRDSEGLPYVVMELVIGVTLGQLVGDGVRLGLLVPAPVGAQIIASAAKGLHAAHEARSPAGVPLGIVHRDVSPQNVLIGDDGRTRLVDFGLARALERLTTTLDGELKGKFPYFSPEQAFGYPLDARSDVFSLGVVAFELFSGRPLFASHGGPAAVLERVKTMPIPSLASVREDIPPGIAGAIGKCLERDPELRFESAEALASALAALEEDVSPNERQAEVAAHLAHVSGHRVERIRTNLERTLAEVVREPTEAIDVRVASDGAETLVDTRLPEVADVEPMIADEATGVRPPSAPRAPRAAIGIAIVIAGAASLAIASLLATGGSPRNPVDSTDAPRRDTVPRTVAVEAPPPALPATPSRSTPITAPPISDNAVDDSARVDLAGSRDETPLMEQDTEEPPPEREPHRRTWRSMRTTSDLAGLSEWGRR